MTIIRISLLCNECGAQSEKLNDGENIKETRLFNKDAGWKYKKVKNGSMWDICPKCVQNHALMRDL